MLADLTGGSLSSMKTIKKRVIADARLAHEKIKREIARDDKRKANQRAKREEERRLRQERITNPTPTAMGILADGRIWFSDGQTYDPTTQKVERPENANPDTEYRCPVEFVGMTIHGNFQWFKEPHFHIRIADGGGGLCGDRYHQIVSYSEYLRLHAQNFEPPGWPHEKEHAPVVTENLQDRTLSPLEQIKAAVGSVPESLVKRRLDDLIFDGRTEEEAVAELIRTLPRGPIPIPTKKDEPHQQNQQDEPIPLCDLDETAEEAANQLWDTTDEE